MLDTNIPSGTKDAPPAYSKLSFVKYERTSKEYYRVTNWFNVPDEEYGDGNITGFMAVSELAQWVKDNPDSEWEIKEVIAEAMRIREGGYVQDKLDKRGAAVTFLNGITSAVMFLANHADFKTHFNALILRQLEFKNMEAFAIAKDKVDFVVRMKAGRETKRLRAVNGIRQESNAQAATA